MTGAVDPSRCVLCGRPNGCAMAAGASEPCWCASATIAAEVLDRIPPALRGVACLCPECASGRVASPGAADRPT